MATITAPQRVFVLSSRGSQVEFLEDVLSPTYLSFKNTDQKNLLVAEKIALPDETIRGTVYKVPGYNFVESYYSFKEADRALAEKGFHWYDKFVINSNMPPIGLPDGLAEKSMDGWLAGCLWMDDIIEKRHDKERFRGNVFFMEYDDAVREWVAGRNKARGREFYGIVPYAGSVPDHRELHEEVRSYREALQL